MFKVILSAAKPCTFQTYRWLTASAPALKKFQTDDLSPDADVILRTGKDSKTMKYSEVLEKVTDLYSKCLSIIYSIIVVIYTNLLLQVGQRNLVKISFTKQNKTQKEGLPMFQIMSEEDLEVATRKLKKTSSAYLGSREIYETEQGKAKMKQMDLKSRISDNDFQYQAAKIVKWLEKGQFVNVTIKVAKGSSPEEAETLKQKIYKLLEDNQDIIPNKSRLTVK